MDQEDLVFHYRALAAAGDPTAITVVRGMELSGCKTLVANERYGTLDMPADTVEGPNRRIAQEMYNLGWDYDERAWYHRHIILRDIDNHD